MKKTISVILAAVLLSGCMKADVSEKPVSESAVPEKTAEAAAAEALPSWKWQIDVRFPDWQGRRNGNYASNDRLSFLRLQRAGRTVCTG